MLHALGQCIAHDRDSLLGLNREPALRGTSCGDKEHKRAEQETAETYVAKRLHKKSYLLEREKTLRKAAEGYWGQLSLVAGQPKKFTHKC